MRIERVELGRYVAALVKDADYLLMVSFKGLKVAELSDLRAKLGDANARLQVLKNTYIRYGLQQNGIDTAGLELSGDTAVVFGKDEASAAARILREYAKTHKSVAFKAAVVDRGVLNAKAAETVADMPSKATLRAMLLGVLQAPARNLVSVLNAKNASLVYALQAYVNKQDGK